MPFRRRVARQSNGFVVRTPGRTRQGQREGSAILYPMQYLLPPGIAEQRIMAGAMVDLVEDHQHPVVIKKLPESFITVFHSLIGIGRAHGTYLAIETPA
ncbi:hypothetical protein D3C78_587870 [compost metagenome]